MKNSMLIVITSLSLAGLSTTTKAYEPKSYNTKRALVSPAMSDVSLSTPMRPTQEQAARTSLFAVRRGVSTTKAQPVSVAFYNTKEMRPS